MKSTLSSPDAIIECASCNLAQATTSVDRRSLRSRRALRDACAAEIEAVGDLSRVTVTAVSERADITRRTFYAHFRDIPDLVRCIENQTIDELRPLVRAVAQNHIADIASALDRHEPVAGSRELLGYFKERGGYLAPLLGDGGDPAFVERIKLMVREEITSRALDHLDARAFGPFFEYYLTFAISAEVGVLVSWLVGGMHESVDEIAATMAVLMFVRPGDLYGSPLDAFVALHGLDFVQEKETYHD